MKIVYQDLKEIDFIGVRNDDIESIIANKWHIVFNSRELYFAQDMCLSLSECVNWDTQPINEIALELFYENDYSDMTFNIPVMFSYADVAPAGEPHLFSMTEESLVDYFIFIKKKDALFIHLEGYDEYLTDNIHSTEYNQMIMKYIREFVKRAITENIKQIHLVANQYSKREILLDDNMVGSTFEDELNELCEKENLNLIIETHTF